MGDSDVTLAPDGAPAKQDRPPERGDTIGRYVVLDRLGAGGMGVVYGAYDPDLDRKLALKLLHGDVAGPTTQASAGQRRLLREAQALAKLNHPNVVAVHDVGEHEGRVFLAMEFVDGETLRSWVEGRSWREIVDAYRAAARGLAAAHRRELVHRDFKPDNVMIGSDGRVRVMDFGLARASGGDRGDPVTTSSLGEVESTLASGVLSEAVTRVGATVGTPAYMAPEQHLGRTVTAASDQFSFCVALYESLYGQRPFVAESTAGLALAIVEGRIRPPPASSVPAWIRKIVLRGLERDPVRRFASMDELVAALARDPAVRRRLALAGVLVVGLAGGAWWIGAREQPAAPPCVDMQRHLAGVWDQPTRAALERATLDSGNPLAGETWPRIERILDDYAQAWVAGRREACEATRVRGEQSEALMDRKMACLDSRLEQLAALVAVLGRGEASVVDRAVMAGSSLPSLARCADAEALLAEVPPPEDPEQAALAVALRGQLAEVAALRYTGELAEALPLADRAVDQARALDHPPSLARALVRRGDVRLLGDAPAEAEPDLIEAFGLAVEHGDAEVAAESSAMLVRLLGQQLARFDEADVWGVQALALAKRRGELDDLTLVRTALGLSADAAGDRQEARAQFEAALELHRSREPASEVGLGVAYNNLGNVAQADGDFARARSDHERAVLLFRSALGPNHPYVANALTNLGIDARGQGRLDEAREFYTQALDIRRHCSGPRHPTLASIFNNLGSVANDEGEYAAAREYFESALDIVREVQGAEHPNVGRILGNLASVAVAQGDAEAALDYAARSLAILEASLGGDHPSLAFGLSTRGRALLLLERGDEAIAPLERAVDLRTRHSTAATDLAESQALLGRALWRTGRDRTRARELADQARATYVEAGDDGEVARIDAWLAE